MTASRTRLGTVPVRNASCRRPLHTANSARETVDEIVLDRAELPAAGGHPDAVLAVTLTDGEMTELSYDATETEARKDRAQSRFDRLAERPPNEDNSQKPTHTGCEICYLTDLLMATRRYRQQ